MLSRKENINQIKNWLVSSFEKKCIPKEKTENVKFQIAIKQESDKQ